MVTENPEASPEISPLISSAPAHVRLTPRQRRVLIFLAFAVPFWLILSLLAIASPMMLFVFLASLGFLIVFYGVRTEYFLFLWFAMTEYDLLVKLFGFNFFGIGLKGVFFAGMLTQLPNKFSLMPRRLFRSVPARWPWYVLIIWMGASLFWSDMPGYGVRLYVRWLAGFFAYAMVFLTINERNKRLFFIVYAVVIGSSVCFGLMQRFGVGIQLEDVTLFAPQEYGIGEGLTMFRASGFSGHPNGLGRECASLFCVLLMMLFAWRPRRPWQVAILGMLGVTAIVTLLSFSRVGWALFAVGAGTFVLLYRPRWLIPLMLFGLAVALLSWAQVWERLSPVFTGTDASLGRAEKPRASTWSTGSFGRSRATAWDPRAAGR